MTDTPDVSAVEQSDDYVHVRFRDPDRFETIRTPDWAENAAESVIDDAEVRTGTEGGDDWSVESVLLPEDEVDGRDETKARAREIVEKIES